MKNNKKKRIKKLFKEKLGWFIGSGLFLIGGVVALLVGFNMTGWSIIDWLKSPYATTAFIIIGSGLLIIVVLLIYYKRMTLGDDNNDK